MKKLSRMLLAQTVSERRKTLKMSQQQLSVSSGINRSLISRLERGTYTPSADQLIALSCILSFNMNDLFISDEPEGDTDIMSLNIAVAGAGYVGLSLAVLLAQHNDVAVICTKPDKAALINSFHSPIRDDYIEKYLSDLKLGKIKL